MICFTESPTYGRSSMPVGAVARIPRQGRWLQFVCPKILGILGKTKLKDFEIRPVAVHPTKRADVSRHGYRAALFEDAFARFLPPEPNVQH